MLTRRQAAEGSLKLVFAFVVALLVVPTTYQLRLPVAPGVPAHSSTQQLSPATAFQQAVPYQGGYQVPYMTLTDALDLYNSYSLAQQAHYAPVVVLQSASIGAGQNITFVVRYPANLSESQPNSLNLYVFVADPSGAVVAASPVGASLSIGSGGGGNIVFNLQANGQLYAPGTYEPEGIEFTWRTPTGDQSVGSWRIFVLMTSGFGPSTGSTEVPWVATESAVQVGQADGSLGFLPGVLASAALFFGIYQAEGSIVASYRRHPDARKWLRDNALWFVAAAFLVAFIVLGYLG